MDATREKRVSKEGSEVRGFERGPGAGGGGEKIDVEE